MTRLQGTLIFLPYSQTGSSVLALQIPRVSPTKPGGPHDSPFYLYVAGPAKAESYSLTAFVHSILWCDGYFALSH